MTDRDWTPQTLGRVVIKVLWDTPFPVLVWCGADMQNTHQRLARDI